MTINEIARTKNWFELAVPTPTGKNQITQLGVHFEEVGEMFTALGIPEIASPLDQLATAFKIGKTPEGDEITPALLTIDRQELLDALCDQIVTAVGVGHMLGMDIVQALARVNDSNWSKFVNGKPVFDDNHKIKKGPDYKAPTLKGLF